MGAKQSTPKPKPGEEHTQNTEINTEVLNETTTNFLTRNMSETSQSGVAVQSLDVSKLKAIGCKLSISQDMDVNATAISEFSPQNTADLKTTMENYIMNDLKAQAEKSPGWKTRPLAKKVEVETTVNQEIKNIVNTNITQDNLNALRQAITASQTLDGSDMYINPCGIPIPGDPGYDPVMAALMLESCKECSYLDGQINECSLPPCKIDQNLQMTIMAQNLTKTINTSIANNETINKIKQEFDQLDEHDVAVSEAEAEADIAASEAGADIAESDAKKASAKAWYIWAILCMSCLFIMSGAYIYMKVKKGKR